MIAPARQRRRRGQGNTEYVIIVALVAIATIGVITLFGDNLRKLFGASADALAGDNNIGNRGIHSSQGPALEKNMSNFAAQTSAYDPGGSNTGGGGETPGFGRNSAF